MEIPLIGLGTYQLQGRKCIEIIRLAHEIGYRHFDTALDYENHKEVGEGLRELKRDELFITSKFFLDEIEDDQIDDSLELTCDRILGELGIEYLDLLLIHWPDRKRPLEAILQSMDRLIEKGKIRFQGVSNYTIHHLQDAYDAGLKVPFNQVEFHPYLYQKELLEFSKTHGTRIIAYRSFGNGELLKEEPLFAEIGAQYGKTPAQVILRWTIQKGIPVIPKASSEQRLKENFTLFDFTLTDEEVAHLDQLHCNKRYCTWEDEEFDY